MYCIFQAADLERFAVTKTKLGHSSH